MEDPAPSKAGRTAICCIAFLDIVGYSKQTDAKQLALKGWLNDLLTQALKDVAEPERIILDTGDGAAICFLGDPEDALFVCNHIRVALHELNYPGLSLRTGINLGPAKIVTDINGQRNVVGDGINVAQRVMSFAEPDQILVSRSYYDVVGRLSDDYTRLFHYHGEHADKHVRKHEVYEVRIDTPPHPLGAGDASSGAQAVAPAAAPEPQSASTVTTAALPEIERELTARIGPLAKLLVTKASRRARDDDALVSELATNIDKTTDRPAFVAACEKAIQKHRAK